MIHEFVAPPPSTMHPILIHTPALEVSADHPFEIKAMIAGIDDTALVMVEVGSGTKTNMIKMQPDHGGIYSTHVPATNVTPGLIEYRIIVAHLGESYTFPGGINGNRFAWDYNRGETFKTYVASSNGRLELFSAGNDRSTINQFNPDWKNIQFDYVTGEQSQQLILKISAKDLVANSLFGFQNWVANKISGRGSELANFSKLVVRAKSLEAEPENITITLINKQGTAYSTPINLTPSLSNVVINLSSLSADSTLLLPRPYPGFQPLWFKPSSHGKFKVEEIDKIQFLINNKQAAGSGKTFSMEIESIWLEK